MYSKYLKFLNKTVVSVYMKFLIDTFSWKKFDLLSEKNLFKVSNLYNWAEIFITHEVKTEIKHFGLKSCNLIATIILPIKNHTIFQDAKSLEFDQADAEILSNGNLYGDLCIISEDKPLLKFAIAYSLNAIQVIDLFQVFNNLELLENRELFQINRFLREKKNITKRKASDIKKWLSKH